MSRRRRHAKPAVACGTRVFGLNHSSPATAFVVFSLTRPLLPTVSTWQSDCMPRPCIARDFFGCTPVREVSWQRNIAQTSNCAYACANVEGGFLKTHSFTYADSACVDVDVSRSNNSSEAPIVISVSERKPILKLQALYREPRDALRTPVSRELKALDHKLDFDQVEYVRAAKKDEVRYLKHRNGQGSCCRPSCDSRSCYGFVRYRPQV